MGNLSGIARPITTEERDYIFQHYQTITVPKMALHLKRATVTIYNFMDANSLPPYRGARDYFKPHKVKEFAVTGLFDVDAVKGEYTWLV